MMRYVSVSIVIWNGKILLKSANINTDVAARSNGYIIIWLIISIALFKICENMKLI